MEIVLVLSLLFIAIILFATEKISVDVVTLCLLIVLVLTGIISTEEAYAGFSSEFIIIIACIFVLGAALEETGILDFLIRTLVKLASKSTGIMLFIVMLATGLISGFLNNTTVTAMFLSPLVGVARKLKISTSKLLMPLAYATILGGTCTLIGTSTNVAVSGYVEKAGIDRIHLFEITPIGLIIFGIGLIYMMTIGRKLLPDNKGGQLTEEYKIQKYLTEVVVQPDSPLIGQNVYDSDLSKKHFRILNVIRRDRKFMPDYRTQIELDDVLLVEGDIDQLMSIKETKGIEIMADMIMEDELENEDIRLAELLITSSSSLIGRTIKQVNFLSRYGLIVLAVSRHGESIRTKIGNVELRMGDMLLVQGPADQHELLKNSSNFVLMEAYEPVLFKKRKGLITISSFLFAIVLGSLGLVPLSICFLGAAVISVLFKCITPKKAYQAIDWRLLILIGGMTAFGSAMDNSYAAEFLANGIVDMLSPYGIYTILAGFILLTVFLTQPMSNAAAALVILPIAMHTATNLDANPRTFAIAIMLSASISLITPFEPACLLVYGPGRYRFTDFIKVGSGLTLILLGVILFTVPYFWPFY